MKLAKKTIESNVNKSNILFLVKCKELYLCQPVVIQDSYSTVQLKKKLEICELN